MAVFIHGVPCALCGNPVDTAEDAVAFAPFVGNRADPLFIFSDAVVHPECLERHPLGARAREMHMETIASNCPQKRICLVCGRTIDDPDDYFGTGMLSSDPVDPLTEFNNVHLHVSHAASWPRLPELRRIIQERERTGAWQGARLSLSEERGVRWARRVEEGQG